MNQQIGRVPVDRPGVGIVDRLIFHEHRKRRLAIKLVQFRIPSAVSLSVFFALDAARWTF